MPSKSRRKVFKTVFSGFSRLFFLESMTKIVLGSALLLQVLNANAFSNGCLDLLFEHHQKQTISELLRVYTKTPAEAPLRQFATIFPNIETRRRIVKFIERQNQEGTTLEAGDLAGILFPTFPSNTISLQPGGSKDQLNDLDYKTKTRDQIAIKIRSLELENQAAKVLALKGFMTTQLGQPDQELQFYVDDLKSDDHLGLNRNPDLIVEDKIFDVYSPNTNNFNFSKLSENKTKQAVENKWRQVSSQIAKKIENLQTHRVVVNLFDSPVLNSHKEIRHFIEILNRSAVVGLHEVLVIANIKGEPKVYRVFP